MERDVIRIITPGTVIEERMLDEGKNNYIVSLFFGQASIGIAYADVSTGGFFVCELVGERALVQMNEELARLQPTQIIAGEIVVDSAISDNEGAMALRDSVQP